MMGDNRLFLGILHCPSCFSILSFEFDHVLLTFVTAKEEFLAIGFNKYLTRTGFNNVAAKRTWPGGFRHVYLTPILLASLAVSLSIKISPF